jgi:hypothetical protein
MGFPAVRRWVKKVPGEKKLTQSLDLRNINVYLNFKYTFENGEIFIKSIFMELSILLNRRNKKHGKRLPGITFSTL